MNWSKGRCLRVQRFSELSFSIEVDLKPNVDRTRRATIEDVADQVGLPSALGQGLGAGRTHTKLPFTFNRGPFVSSSLCLSDGMARKMSPARYLLFLPLLLTEGSVCVSILYTWPTSAVSVLIRWPCRSHQRSRPSSAGARERPHSQGSVETARRISRYAPCSVRSACWR